MAMQPLDDYRLQLVVDTAEMSLVEAMQPILLTIGSDIVDIQIQPPSLETVVKTLFTQGNRGTTAP
ncbi:MAG: hypothetical protein AB2990_03670 [Candidatus Symbiodolus clandestinus]